MVIHVLTLTNDYWYMYGDSLLLRPDTDHTMVTTGTDLFRYVFPNGGFAMSITMETESSLTTVVPLLVATLKWGHLS